MSMSTKGEGAPRERSALLSQPGWCPCNEVDVTQWQVIGRGLGRFGRHSQWWIGDWLLYARNRWGDMYTAARKITGYDYGSLRNMASTASKFELSRRRDALSWGHHTTVASLTVEEQDYWLDRALELRWSREDLRSALRTARRVDERRIDGSRWMKPHGAENVVICPHCSAHIPLSGATAISRDQVRGEERTGPRAPGRRRPRKAAAPPRAHQPRGRASLRQLSAL